MVKRNHPIIKDEKREANREFLDRRRKHLRNNGAAQAALLRMKLSEDIQKNFYLGLSERYIDSEKLVHENALIAPIINVSGKPTNQSIYINLPGVTVNPTSKMFWSRGDARTYHSRVRGKNDDVVVCGDVLSLWRLYDVLNQNGEKDDQQSKILLIASSDSDSFPKEWKEKEFWSGFENIYFAFTNDAVGDKNALKAAQIAAMPTKRLRLPVGFDWLERNASSETELTQDEFDRLILAAEPVSAKVKPETNKISPGRYGYQPVDIAGTYYNGHLYYPVKTLNNVLDKYHDESGKSVSQISSRTEVVLVRSDRTIQTVCEVPAPRGTPLDERVLKLSDGTLIESRPKASDHSTWSWDSIEKFCSGKSGTRSLTAILNDVKGFLKRAVWLPFERDYDLLTLLVPVTFSQTIFKAVPLVLVTGSPGSGKTALGNAMIKVCANASTVGQISAAAVARLIDQTKGFVVFDDLESIGKRKREAAHFTELVQALKLSYNRETSLKTWTDVSRGMSVKRLNFYGVKMINNTTGTDEILGSRVIKIFTRKVPSDLQSFSAATEPEDEIKLKKLRDELHTWTFENVGLIDQTYQRLFPVSTDRATEIYAPLRVFAELSQNEDLQSGLVRALEFQNAVSKEIGDPIKIFQEAVKCLVIEGHTAVSPTQILIEMEKMIVDKPYQSFDESLKWKNTAWVGRQLRLQAVVNTNALSTRQLLMGKYVRVYPVKQGFIDSVIKR